ncbi:MAG TPA: antibiotic biosynthesis monooxygenase [Acidisarcina sp.]
MVVWEFQVKAGCEQQFIEAYGPQGAWAMLFRQSPGFMQVELKRSSSDALRFFTFDLWESSVAYESFCEKHSGAYEVLDRKLAGLMQWERRVGAFPRE